MAGASANADDSNVSNQPEISSEVDLAARALATMISTHLAAGANRCVLAAACVWGGVKEMSEVTSSTSAAEALRTIANEIDPPVDLPRQRVAGPADGALMVAVREHAWAGRAARQRATDDTQSATVNQEIASDVVGEAIDLLDQGQPVLARALLMALRARFVEGARPQPAVVRRRWGG